MGCSLQYVYLSLCVLMCSCDCLFLFSKSICSICVFWSVYDFYCFEYFGSMHQTSGGGEDDDDCDGDDNHDHHEHRWWLWGLSTSLRHHECSASVHLPDSTVHPISAPSRTCGFHLPADNWFDSLQVKASISYFRCSSYVSPAVKALERFGCPMMCSMQRECVWIQWRQVSRRPAY